MQTILLRIDGKKGENMSIKKKKVTKLEPDLELNCSVCGNKNRLILYLTEDNEVIVKLGKEKMRFKPDPTYI